MMLDIGKVKKIGLFASGVLFGTAGVKVLGSKDAKKFYINCLAAGLRAKGLRYDYCNQHPGECRRYPCRS